MPADAAGPPSTTTTERTPLIPKSHSVTIIPHVYEDDDGDADSLGEDEGPKGREVEVYKPGKSTFTQTVRLLLPTSVYTQLMLMLTCSC